METEMINHFSHPHPLVLLDGQETGDESKKGDCDGCGDAIGDDGLSYGCGDCSYFLHKKCADMPREIHDHPLHPQHTLVLYKTPYPSGAVFLCNLCRKGRGFNYRCASCDFDLDVGCATHPQFFTTPSLKKLQHFGHDHPLFFVEDVDSTQKDHCCSECRERMGTSFYCCPGCLFYLHKGCAEASIEMNKLGHGGHPVLLLPNILPKLPPRQEVTSSCLFGQRSDEQFIYYCFSCNLDIGGVKDTCISTYPLALTEEVVEDKGESYLCFRCGEHTPDPVYHSITMDKFLHRKCAELPVKISNHPLHPPHPLFLLSYWERSLCLICGKFGKSTYGCTSCRFYACSCCAMKEKFLDGNLRKIQHSDCDDNLLILIEETDIDRIRDCDGECSACKENIYAPYYYCPEKFKFALHKNCAKLPLEIYHPSHRKHPLALLASPPPRRNGCSRNYLYEKSYEGCVYYCSICDFGIKCCDAFLQTVTGSHHQHPFAPVFKPISFMCDACGIEEDHCSFPHTCPEYGLMVHKKCASLRKKIKITRHQHRLSHIYSLQEKEDRKRECNICLDEVNTAFGSYCCLACDYFAHVGCALNKFHLEEGSEDEDEDDVSFEINHGDQREHFSHEHSLMFNDCIIEDGKSCDGCMQLISTSHYSCAICEFFLHKSCFELPKKRRHWTSKKPLTLKFYVVFECNFCDFYGSGFCYEGAKVANGEIEERMCIRCYRIPDIVTTERHKHRLIFDNEYKEKCSGCGAKSYGWSRIGHFKFKCKVCSGFALCYRCLTQPDTVEYKLDVHPLVLCTSPETHDPSQSYCDWCEEGKDPTHWFYHCADCDLPLDLDCALGIAPFVKLGKPFRYKGHEEHLVTFMKIEFNAPKCNKCKRRCGDVSLQCTKPDCDYMVHWKWPCAPYTSKPILHED